MTHLKLTVSYDGTPFVGWQRQGAGVSIQGLLEDALAILDGAPVAVAGAGRTDAGVHALGQVASVTLRRDIDAGTVVRALNARLPAEVRVLDAALVNAGFHARFSRGTKTYRYRIWNAPVVSPIERAYVWHLPAPPLDVDAMDRAARRLEGTHDFSAFQGTGTRTVTAERTVFSSRVSRPPWRVAGPGGDAAEVIGQQRNLGTPAAPPLLVYEVTGDGFLRYMVRTIVGTLAEIGRGKRSADWMGDVLASRRRATAGETAPPQGLFLVGVTYSGADL